MKPKKAPEQDYCSNKNSEIQPKDRQVETVRLPHQFGNLPKRKSLGDPYKGK